MTSSLAGKLAGRYTIDREIGRGGMATVYLARDVRHARNVALKVLNPELGAVLGVERFLAEIAVTASLQHPNLLPLFDSGEVDGNLFYVMPYIDGETLRARLEREKQLPVDEAVRIAAAIAGALDYAHRHNVIHRDLKPENVLMHEGQPLIADFGIALAVSNAGGSRITQTGLSLGTPHYMSPEQATGDRAIDGRADIYALGAMTYEMLVGDPPHIASTSQAIIAKVLTEPPPRVRTARPSVPAHVDGTVARALEKLPADRYSSAREFAESLDGRTGVSLTSSEPRSALRPRTRELAAWSIAGLALAALAWRMLASSPATPARVIRANFDLPPNVHVADAIVGPTIAVSPSGDMIAFTSLGVAGFHMYVRRVNEIAAREVSDAAGRNLTFSPDGRWLAFTEGNVLKKVSVDGGQTITVGTTGSATPYGIAWSPADTVYIGSFTGLWKIPVGGGAASPVGGADPSQLQTGRRWPFVLPDGKTIAFITGSNSSSSSKIATLDPRTGASVEFDHLAMMPLGIIDDQFVYVSPAGELMALPWDRRANKPKGTPVKLDDGVLTDYTAGAKASLSASGTLAYLKGRAQFQPVMATAGSSTVTPLMKEEGIYATPRFSPDGKRVAITLISDRSTDVWIYDVTRNTFTRLTTEGSNLRPEWTPDGREVIFISTRANKTGIWSQPADGSGPAHLLYDPPYEPFEVTLSPDGQWLIYRTAPGAEHSRDILAVPMNGPKTITEIAAGTATTESMPRISPDGHWIAYQSNETGRFEIYVRPFPGTGARVTVSDEGGNEPLWSRDGHSLYYRGPTTEIIQVAVTTGASFSIGARKPVLSGQYLTDSSHPDYDVAPDGRFLMLRRTGAEAQTVVVHNWATELRERTAPRR